ncbi:hypothetical protein D7A28_12200 [Salmonella enterica]|uniref:Uncharacterized protein n=1 Tax=Salmonella montevideo TaxID=115981 RepID=A0A5X1V4D7_SALMO|nr:hypothetical protein AW70_44880 [Salmonella enterica subsp. enterica serovar Montevideo str. CDC 86-0391]ASE03311.1 hypothetical protein LFZ40_21475 [Salmonella enterica subsp. enterica serovar Quebec str. S-1267]ATT62582.1 hypothetical protein AW63_18125 [Salmonella enterica subsp. enterica serovar Montevideo str. USDA-ARS-USMARC-1900]ATT66916.1 hypothetical protein AW47_17840 [Salmonella enterica subsp. enterica serovar Montevideo str. USDA-ARS-USMARC-1901]ATT71355.1 hypothetical protein A
MAGIPTNRQTITLNISILYHQYLSELAAITLSQGIPVILQAACALAFLAHPSHELMYVPGDSLPCRLDAT